MQDIVYHGTDFFGIDEIYSQNIQFDIKNRQLCLSNNTRKKLFLLKKRGKPKGFSLKDHFKFEKWGKVSKIISKKLKNYNINKTNNTIKCSYKINVSKVNSQTFTTKLEENSFEVTFASRVIAKYLKCISNNEKKNIILLL